jgi:signal transduction histidine kinase
VPTLLRHEPDDRAGPKLSEGALDLVERGKQFLRRLVWSPDLDARQAPRQSRARQEVAAYYVVSEALTNTAKHANAFQVDIEASARDGSLRLSIRDDGVGGADPAGGSGLVGLRDRVEALSGSIEITSPPGHGTHIVVQFSLELDLTVDSPLVRQSLAGSVAASPRERGRGRSRT